MEIPTTKELLDRFTYYDYSVFISMLAMSGAIGLFCAFHGGAQNTIRQLLMGNKQLTPVPVGTSLMASFISAAYLLGNASEVYRNGTLYAMTFLSYLLALAVTAHLFMPIFYQLDIMTAYEYLELRFSRMVRMAAVAIYTLEMTIYISISLYAPALALSQLTGMTLWSAVAAIGLVCTVYTSIGGIKAVVYTDTFQAVVTVLAMVVVVLLGIREMGGFQKVWDICRDGHKIQFDEVNPNPMIHQTIWGLSIGMFFTNAASYATNQMMVLRYLTVPTLREAKIVVWLNFPYLCIVLALSCFAGLLVYSKYATCDIYAIKQISTEDQLLPYFVMDVLGKLRGIPGLFVAGIFAASLSSISSGVNALASVYYVDVIAVFRKDISEQTGARIINGLGVFFGLLTIGLVAVASHMGNVLAASQVINSAIGGPLLGLFTVGMFVPMANSKGALSGLFVSLTLSLWLNLGAFVHNLGTASPPATVDGCPEEFRNVTGFGTYATGAPNTLDVYKLSNLWYSMIAFFIVIIVAVPVSYFTSEFRCASSPTNAATLNPKLICQLADVVFWFAPEKFRRHFRLNVGNDYVEPSKPQEEKTPVKHITLDIPHKAPKESLSTISYIRSITDLSFPEPPSLRRSSCDVFSCRL
ncbi:sodium-coupled monocarboxylate transporter 1-like [Ixodes scapularis]